MTVAHETAIDESFNRRPAAQLYAAGARILVVYATGQGKAITDAEWNAYLGYRASDGGHLALVLVDEHGNQQMLNGPGFGGAIAREMLAVAQRRLPPSRPLYYVADDPSPLPRGRWAEVADRFREICAAHLAAGWAEPGDTVGGSLVGAYGSGPLLEYLYSLGLARWPWAVSTWGPCPHAVLIQDANTRKDRLGGAVDWDYLPAGVVDCGQYPPPDQGALSMVTDADFQALAQRVDEIHARVTEGVAVDDAGTPMNASWTTATTLAYLRAIRPELEAMAVDVARTAVPPAPAAAGAMELSDAAMDALAERVAKRLGTKLGA